MKKRYAGSFLLIGCLLVLLFWWNVASGSVEISVSELIEILKQTSQNHTAQQIIWQIRLPRVLSAILLGGALSVSGFCCRAFFRIRLPDRMYWEFLPVRNWMWL